MRAASRLARHQQPHPRAQHHRPVSRTQPHLRLWKRRQDRVYLGSADWMHRNLYERVEVMFHLRNPTLCDQVLREVVAPYIADTEKTRYLLADGNYVRAREASAASRSRNGFRFNAQEYLLGFAQGAAPLPAIPGLASLCKPWAMRKSAEHPA